MTVIAENDRETVRELFARELVADVELLFFTRSHAASTEPGAEQCETCDDTHELLDELVGLSDRVQLTTCDVAVDPQTSVRYNVTAVPTVLLRRVKSDENRAAPGGDAPGQPNGAGVRFVGLPGGYEFTTLIADIVDVSRGVSGLAAETLDAVRAIAAPTHIQVFVTPG
jgi:alkyl hydroperoxide reductase subunit AhpF